MTKSMILSVLLLGTTSLAAQADCPDTSALQPGVVEVIEFSLMDGVSEDDFLEAAAEIETSFFCSAPGFVSRTLTQRSDGTWLDLVHWVSLEEALAAADAIMVDATAGPFMEAIDPSSIDMQHWTIARQVN